MHRQAQINKGVTGFKQASLFVALLAFCTLLLLFTNVNLASAQETRDINTSKSVPAIEQILRFGLSPELRMARVDNSNPSNDGVASDDSLSPEQAELASAGPSRITMYRLYNKWTGEHFYTSNEEEKNNVVKAGWTDEGTGWIAPGYETDTPVYRLYNPYVEGGDHHYTTDKDECDKVQAAGWSYEGIGWYSVDEGEEDRIEVYRQYNPFAETGTHNYTISKEENDYLVNNLWREEGVAWYAYSKGIQELDFTKAVVDQSNKTYTGKQIKPEASVTGLTLDVDYKVSYGTNTQVATSGGTITIYGIGAYTGSKTYNFTISPLDISGGTVHFGNASTLTYNTAEQTQIVSKVVKNGVTVSSSDFTVSNNTQKNAGTYTLKVTGKGNCTGEATAEFKILPLDINKTGAVVTLGRQLVYDGTLQTQAVSTVIAGGIALGSVDYEVSNNQATDPGDYTLTITVKNNFTGSITYPFTIQKANLANATVTLDKEAFHYTGADVAPKLTVTIGGKTLTEDVDYEMSNDCSAVNVGNYVLTVSGLAPNYEGSKSVNWEIKKNDYWMMAAGKDDPTPESAVASDIYKNQDVIEADIEQIKQEITDGASEEVTSKFQEYQTLMNNDAYHLYTAWNGDDATQSADKFVEFRIIQVGEHLNDSTDAASGDGSAVTFMATHSLPTAQQMNSENTNAGGWTGSKMYQTMNDSNGYVMAGLSDLASAVKSVTKKSTAGNKTDGWTETTSTDTFWLLSYSELAGEDKGWISSGEFKNEGSQYDWCKTNVTNPNGSNEAIEGMDKTRSVSSPAGSDYTFWWERSPYVTFSSFFGIVSASGYPTYAEDVSKLYGVVPAFSF